MMGRVRLAVAACLAVAAGTVGAAEGTAPARELGVARLESRSLGLATVRIGRSGHLLRTRDGGRHWQDVTPPRIAGVIDDWAWDGRRGWVVTGDCVGNGGVVVHRTTDGGRTWLPSPRLGSISCAAGSRVALEFAGSRHGWLVHVELVAGRAELRRTTDGGRSWSRARPLPLPGEVRFRTLRDGWLARGDLRDGQALFATRDGGRTWARQTVALPARHRYAQPLYGLPTFIGPSGVLPVTLLARARTAVAFYTTADGGRTWRLRAVRRIALGRDPRNPFAKPAPTAITGPRSWWLISGRDLTRIDVTGDGGRTWRPLPAGLPPSRFADISAFDRAGWITTTRRGGHRRLFATTDAGHTWRELHP
jgi:photosystem II stability/assembly factor-like uncharacterized protein